MGRPCGMRGIKEFAYPELVAKPEGQRPLGGNGGRAEDNIKIDIKEVCGSLYLYLCALG